MLAGRVSKPGIVRLSNRRGKGGEVDPSSRAPGLARLRSVAALQCPGTRREESVLQPTKPVRAIASARIEAPGADALRFDRSLLPALHVSLLDFLGGLEQALSLLAVRKGFKACSYPSNGGAAQFCDVRSIVASVTKRSFTLKHLSQLAAVVPEAVAILPPQTPAESRRNQPRRSDHFVVRLDDVDRGQVAGSHGQGNLNVSSARARKALLHRRLLAHVEDAHKRFLDKRSIEYEGILWHESFDLQKHVPDLPAPPLYPEVVKQSSGQTTTHRTAMPTSARTPDSDPLAPISQPSSESTITGIIPRRLLDRVRAREAAQLERNAKSDAFEERLALQRLPATMDAVRSLFAGSKRSAMGWSSLIAAVVASHPNQWDACEIEDQLNTLTKVAFLWCEKKALSGPRGGFSFRVVDDSRFATVRKELVDCYAEKSRVE
jgi:DNA replication factor Cdt1 C-terminal domain/DNA replication factor CDT1 like